MKKRKYPLVKQLSSNDCGVACTLMILKALINSKLSMEQVQYIIKTTKNGTSYIDIKKGLESLGVKSEVYKCEMQIDAFDEMKFPCITQIIVSGEPHFVVLYDAKKDLLLADPTKDKIERIKKEEFIKNWIPYIVSIEEIKLTDKYYDLEKNNNIWSFQKVILPQGFKIVLSWIVCIFIYLLGIISTGMYSAFLDFVIPNKYISVLLTMLIVYSQFIIISSILNFVNAKLSIKINDGVDKELIKNLLVAFFNQDYTVLEQYDKGEILTRFRNISNIRATLLYYIQVLPIDILGMVVLIGVLQNYSVELLMLTFVPIILWVGMLYLSHEKMRENSIKLFDGEEQFNNCLIDVINNIYSIKTYQAEAFYQSHVFNKIQTFFSERKTFLLFDLLQTNIKNLILSLYNLYILGLGAYLVIQDRMAEGSLLVFTSLSMQLFNPIIQIVNMQANYEQAIISMQRYKGISNLNVKRKFGNLEIQKIENMQMQDISFGYNGEKEIISGVTIELQGGKNIAFTGKSGVGKTTLAKLISNYHEIHNGKILINGVDVNNYSETTLLSNILYVTDKVELFSGTILENITLGRNVDIEKINEIASKIGFDRVIKQFPSGYDTFIGDKGYDLSMGEKQLLNIIRSTLCNYEIIIFDEVTNGLDSELKESVCKYLLGYGNIKIFITHDNDLIKKCDDVYNIKKGEIIRN